MSADLHENVPITDVFCSGLGAIEKLDGNVYRLWFYVLEAPPAEEGLQEKVVVARIIAPISAISDAVLRLVASINTSTATLTCLVPDIMH